MSDERQETSPPENTTRDLWESARYLLRWLVSVCGDPCALVGGGWLSRKDRREILHWLRPVEAIVRRLLVAEAAQIAQTLQPDKENAAAVKSAPYPGDSPAARPRFCRVHSPDPEKPASWSVRFSVYGKGERPPAGRAALPGPRIRTLGPDPLANVLSAVARAEAAARHRARVAEMFRDTLSPQAERPKASLRAGNPWNLARRIEALARVLENPQTYARRLARRLRKQAAWLTEACRPPPPPEPGHRPRYGDEALRHASARALEALAPFDTS
jgi:hypothetical protein